MHSTDATGGTGPELVIRRPLVDLRTGEEVDDLRRLAYNAPEVAERLGVTERYVRTLLATGELQSVKLANRRMVLAEDLDAFVEKLKAERDQARGVA